MTDEQFQTAVIKRLDAIESRLGGVESRLGGVESRLGGVESDVRTILDHFDIEAERDNLATATDRKLRKA